jgi:hypothetical protein
VRREVYYLFKELKDEIEVQVEADPILTSSQVSTILFIQANSYTEIKTILLNQTSYFFAERNEPNTRDNRR